MAEENKDIKVQKTDKDNIINVTLEPTEPREFNPSLADLQNKAENISRMKDKGIINEVSGSAMCIRENGQINLSSGMYAQYKINPNGRAQEHSFESITMTNRKRFITDDFIINEHKMNPKLWELTDFKKIKLPTNEEALVGNFCIYGSVLVKAWEANLKRYVMIRRPARIPMFSPLMNLPEIANPLGINDPLKIDEDILALSDKGYQVNGLIKDAKSLVGKAGEDRGGINRKFRMTIGGAAGGSMQNSGSLGGGNIEPAVVYKFLKTKGYDDQAAAAIMGNIQQESSFNTGADNGTHYGLCQWGDSRLENLKQLASSTNRQANDGMAQLDYMWSEIASIHECSPGEMNGKSISDCVAAWDKYFERSGGADMGRRNDYANSFYSKMQSGGL